MDNFAHVIRFPASDALIRRLSTKRVVMTTTLTVHNYGTQPSQEDLTLSVVVDGNVPIEVKIPAIPAHSSRLVSVPIRVSGHDLYLDLPVAPWEAVLGATLQVPTLGGSVSLKVPPGTRAGQQLRLTGRGLPKPRTGEGDLFAIVQIAVPGTVGDRERALYRELAGASSFNPRGHFAAEAK